LPSAPRRRKERGEKLGALDKGLRGSKGSKISFGRRFFGRAPKKSPVVEHFALASEFQAGVLSTANAWWISGALSYFVSRPANSNHTI
jgi:hypothetical protein